MKLRILSIVMGLLGLTLYQQVLADVGGTVYQDLPVNGTTLNTYGVKDANELGIAGITITAYQADGTSQTMITASDGLWTLATTGNVRVEFSTIPSYLRESPDGGNQNASVQFSADGGTVDFGLHDVSDYSDTVNPLYVNNLQQNGTHIGGLLQNLHTVHYDATGLNATENAGGGVLGTGEIPQDTIAMDQLGSVWGKAYQADKQRLFVASMLQRHVGFANSPADIYVTDYSSLDFSTALPAAAFLGRFSLQGKIPANGGSAVDLGTVDRASGTDYFLYDNPLTQNIDLDAYAKVGKISYGGVDIDDNDHKLWLVNLNQKGLISVDISGDFNSLSTASVNQYLIESLPNAPTCTGGFLRPWALKIHQGKGYLGALCDAATSKSRVDMNAFVLSYDLADPTSGFTQELTFSLDYDRYKKDWSAWEDTYVTPPADKIHNEPILSDIEFDKYNNMYLAFFDRYAVQIGQSNLQAISGTTLVEDAYANGEILKICNTNGVYEKEGSGSCLDVNYTEAGVSEFFNDQGGDRGKESSLGSLAILKGSGEILLVFMDPHPESTTGQTITTYHFSHGAETLNLTNGSINNWYANTRTYSNLDSNVQSGRGLNGKANGMGDIELITAPAPIELGNRVWVDTDGDGVQDADEAGISGTSVELDCAGAVVSTAITNANGNYIFSNDPSGVSTSSHKYNVTALVAAVDNCLVRIPNISGGSKQAVLGANSLTTANTGEGASSNQNDSDGIVSGDNGEANVAAAEIRTTGANNHSFDFGFRATPTTGSISIIKNATPDDPQDFAFIATGAGTSNFTLDDDTDATLSNTQTFTGLADGAYSFTETPVANWLLNGISCTGNTNSTITTNATGVDIALSGNESIVCTFYNNTHSCPAGQLQNIATITANETETTYANNSDAACLEVTSPTCSIVATAVVNACVNGGNDSDTSNDNYTIALTVTGLNASANFDYSSTPTGVSGTAIPFASSPYTTPAIIIESTDSPLTLTVTDSVDSNCSTTVTPVITEPASCSNAAEVDLRVTKIVDKSAALSGDTLVYTITVTNDGPSDATGVQITDNLPTGVTYQSHVAEAGTTFTSGAGIWNIGSVAVGQTVTLEITVTVD